MTTHIARSIVAAFVVALAPALALAEDPPAAVAPPASTASGPPPGPAAPPPTAAVPTSPVPLATPAPPQPFSPSWSFGAGVGYSLYTIIWSGAPSSMLWYSSELPTIATSLERRLSDRSWLTLGLAGTLSRNRTDVPETASSRDDVRQLLATVGVRRVVTRSSAPVQVSMVYALQGGILDVERRSSGPAVASPFSQDQTSWLAGAQLGIAVERELAEGLALRVASPLLDGHYAWTHARSSGQPSATTSSVFVRALLAPSLELRLLF